MASRFHFEGNHRVRGRDKRAIRRGRRAIEPGTNTIGDARLLKLEINRFCVVRLAVSPSPLPPPPVLPYANIYIYI